MIGLLYGVLMVLGLAGLGWVCRTDAGPLARKKED